MPLKVNPPSPNQDPGSSHEKEPLYALSESLRSFEGTPAESLFIDALKGAGIDPKTYKLDDILTDHNNYVGLPATEPAYSKADEASPIISAIYKGLENGTIIDEQIYFLDKSVRVNKNSPNQFLNRLDLIDTSTLRDAETGDAIAYATGLSSEGGRPGYVICSINDLEVSDK